MSSAFLPLLPLLCEVLREIPGESIPLSSLLRLLFVKVSCTEGMRVSMSSISDAVLPTLLLWELCGLLMLDGDLSPEETWLAKMSSGLDFSGTGGGDGDRQPLI